MIHPINYKKGQINKLGLIKQNLKHRLIKKVFDRENYAKKNNQHSHIFATSTAI